MPYALDGLYRRRNSSRQSESLYMCMFICTHTHPHKFDIRVCHMSGAGRPFGASQASCVGRRSGTRGLCAGGDAQGVSGLILVGAKGSR